MTNIIYRVLVTVVIPTYNRPDLVCRAVASALSQTHTNLEIIVVVDGPDRATIQKLQQVKDNRIKIVELHDKVGGAEARNVGVRKASGEWIAFLDDDDEWLPEKLERQLTAANRHTVPFPVISSRFIARTPVCDYLWPRRMPNPFEPLSDYLFVRKSLFFGEGLLQTSTLFAKKELCKKIPFVPGQKKHQDWDWVLRVCQLDGFSIEILEEPLVVWYVEEGRSSVSTENTWLYSLEWIRRNRHLVTKKAFAAFVATQVGPQAANLAAWKTFWPLFFEMFRFGKPRVIDVLTYLGMWLVPQQSRRKVRALLAKKRV